MKGMRIFFIIGLVLWVSGLSAQMEYAYIEGVVIEGNRKTRDRVILRELSVRPGDTVSLEDLPAKLLESEQLLMNTGLFQSAKISYNNWEGATNAVELLISIRENWYIYPIPTFELADRNFNVWF